VLELIAVAVVALIVGWKLSSAWNTLIFKKILDDLGIKETDLRRVAERLEETYNLKQSALEPTEESQNQTPRLTNLEIRIEQHGDTLYAYRLDNDQFLGQGRDRDQLIESLKHNLTNVKIIVDRDNGADLLKY